MSDVTLGFSPCPNDTFMFHAMIHGAVDVGSLNFIPHIYDIQTLNSRAASKELQVTKLSAFAYLKLKDSYDLLDSGAALGYGCGPLLVARSADLLLEKARIAVPGAETTAHLLLRMWYPDVSNVVMTSFETILSGIESGEYDAGVVIHEGRFVYQDYGCVKIVDLGEWWEKEMGLPIPLGCIVIRRDAETIGLKKDVERIIRESIQYAFDHREASRDFIKEHAQEMDDTVIESHISLYVNDFSLSLGDTGRKAMETLEEQARCHKII